MGGPEIAPKQETRMVRRLAALTSVFGLLVLPVHAADFAAPETVTLLPGKLLHPLPGEFRRGSATVEAPAAEIRFDKKIEIMRHQVRLDDYLECVASGVCRALDRTGSVKTGESRPVTGTSHEDATDYARWLGTVTGHVWRLPTDAEWAYAAGSRFGAELMANGGGSADPSAAWIDNYRRMSQAEGESDGKVHPSGHFGANEHGLFDMAGNVWEWTDSCYVRAVIDDAGNATASIENCGVRVAEGRHRTYVTSFIRDAAAGGCSVGTPPDHLGFRLVRAERAGFLGRLSAWFANAE
jgi:formylglycine-generating enzyme required for sulfatase activity